MNIFFAYPWILYGGIVCLIGAWWWRAKLRKPVLYQFPLVQVYVQSVHGKQLMRKNRLMMILRSLTLLLLILITARPQSADERSEVNVEGIAVMLVLDVSGSMDCFDDLNNPKSRFEIAQEEAIKFINRRKNDQFGLVLFGAVAATRAPLTADKKIVTEIIQDTKLGAINPNGTVLAMGIAMGVNRLRNSPLKSKIMVVLTDGEPSPEDINIRIAIDLAKKAGIKVYTIGIGSPAGGFIQHPYGGIVQMPASLNVDLLTTIAQETGGMFFKASNQKELEDIYKQIDMFEKTKHQAPIYAHYYEYYWVLLLFACILLCIDIIMSSWMRITL